MISQNTAERIWSCYREVAVGEELLAEIEKQLAERRFEKHLKDAPCLQDAFGREQHLSLGVPSGENSTRLFKVRPRLSLSVIRAHIAEKKAELVEANEQARIELDTHVPVVSELKPRADDF